MGQVWQATDTQLNRQVALKILPDAFAADPDRLARFTREDVLPVPAGSYVGVSISPDGRQAAVGTLETDNRDVYVAHLETSHAVFRLPSGSRASTPSRVRSSMADRLCCQEAGRSCSPSGPAGSPILRALSFSRSRTVP